MEAEERCQRCGEMGQDRRTLWHSCFYDMGELGLPFELCAIIGRSVEKTGERVVYPAYAATAEHEGAPALRGPVFADPDETEEPRQYRFFTLRVCKGCRAAWMQAIVRWFGETLQHPPADADIPIREHGATRMVTAEEYARLYPGQVPIRLPRNGEAPDQ